MIDESLYLRRLLALRSTLDALICDMPEDTHEQYHRKNRMRHAIHITDLMALEARCVFEYPFREGKFVLELVPTDAHDRPAMGEAPRPSVPDVSPSAS